MTDEVSEFSRPRAKMTSLGDGVKNTPRSIATVEWSSVSNPVDLDIMLLQGEEYHEGRNGDSASERGGGDAGKE